MPAPVRLRLLSGRIDSRCSQPELACLRRELKQGESYRLCGLRILASDEFDAAPPVASVAGSQSFDLANGLFSLQFLLHQLKFHGSVASS